MIEIWKDVVGYEGVYSVSNRGRIRRDLAYGGTRAGRFCKINLSSDPYPRVGLCKNGKVKTFRVHVLMGQTFLKTKEKGLEINHEDGNKHNNYLSNLSYVTKSQNKIHGYETGLILRGEKCSFSKLTEKDVLKIRLMYKTGGYTLLDLAVFFQMSRTQIADIIK